MMHTSCAGGSYVAKPSYTTAVGSAATAATGGELEGSRTFDGLLGSFEALSSRC